MNWAEFWAEFKKTVFGGMAYADWRDIVFICLVGGMIEMRYGRLRAYAAMAIALLLRRIVLTWWKYRTEKRQEKPS